MAMGEKEKQMSKYKKMLVSQIQEKRKYEKNQTELKHKHGIDEDGKIVVVEKNNTIKFLIRTLGEVISKVAQIIILILTIIGLMTLVYPELREPFLKIVQQIKLQFFSLW